MKKMIERLREAGRPFTDDLHSEAADALERLNADNERLSNLLQGNAMYLEAELSERTTERDLALERGAERSEQLSKQDLKMDRLTAELETERMRLAACGVAALCNTRDSAAKQRIDKDNPYYSASYGDVCRHVDIEIEQREHVERLTAERDALLTKLDEHRNLCVKRVAEVTKERDALRADAERLNKIAHLIGNIFVYGGFKAETHNEVELEKLLRENGTFWESVPEYEAARVNPPRNAHQPDDTALLRMALEALENMTEGPRQRAITALRERLGE